MTVAGSWSVTLEMVVDRCGRSSSVVANSLLLVDVGGCASTGGDKETTSLCRVDVGGVGATSGIDDEATTESGV